MFTLLIRIYKRAFFEPEMLNFVCKVCQAGPLDTRLQNHSESPGLEQHSLSNHNMYNITSSMVIKGLSAKTLFFTCLRNRCSALLIFVPFSTSFSV